MSTLRPKALGWLSIGLGATAVAAPTITARLLGAPVTDRTRTTLRAVGIREIGVGAGLLSGKRSPAALTWLRVLGDAMDLSLLFGALGARRSRRERLVRSLGVIAGITALDVLAAVMQTQEERAATT